jgi:hypothetical protein
VAVIKVKITVPELANVLSLFDRIEVQRSVAGPPTFGDAAFTTGLTATAAAFSGTEEGPFIGLQGQSLQLKVDEGTVQTVTFTAANPVSLSNVITEFNGVIVGAIASDDAGKLKITSSELGTDSVLEIIGGTAVVTLGFTVAQKSTGLDPHVTLLPGVSEYTYDDQSGLATNYYRTRYKNSISSNVSSYSDWIQGSSGAAIDGSLLAVGTVKLADIDGTAIIGGKVTVVNVFSPLISGGFFIAGRSKTVETDATGQAQITLVRGAEIDVIIEGTSVIRRIVVPNVSPFDLLDPLLQTDDPFGIQTPDLPAAVRRS